MDCQEIMPRVGDILEDLTDVELKKFKHLLAEYGIPAGIMEKADACMLADVIKKQFGDNEKILVVIKSALKRIPRKDLLPKLQFNDVPDGQKKKWTTFFTSKAPNRVKVRAIQQQDLLQPESIEINCAPSEERTFEDYGRNEKLRYACILQLAFGAVIIILGTASAIKTPHRQLLPLRIPWWSGLLFSFVGMMPLVALRKTERCKLILLLVCNIVGFLIAAVSFGLSVWNGLYKLLECQDCLATFHWLILFFVVLQLVLSFWNIVFISFWLNKENSKKFSASANP